MSENAVALDHAPSQASASHGRPLNRFSTVVLVAYLVFIVALMVLRRATLSVEVLVVFASVVAVMLGRGRAFARDWAPFLLNRATAQDSSPGPDRKRKPGSTPQRTMAHSGTPHPASRWAGTDRPSQGVILLPLGRHGHQKLLWAGTYILILDYPPTAR